MPLVRVELPAGKAADYRASVGEAIQEAMHAALKVPLDSRSSPSMRPATL
jgi:hypothetical protein